MGVYTDKRDEKIRTVSDALEEVKVKKVVEQETVEGQETIRLEQIDIDGEGRTVENELVDCLFDCV